MGMYDYVKGVSIKCPRCGKAINDFQTKSFERELDHITKKQLFELIDERKYGTSVEDYDEGAHIYTFCDNCEKNGYHTWVEFTMKKKG